MADRQSPSQTQEHHEEQLFHLRQSFDYPPPPPAPIHPDLQQASPYALAPAQSTPPTHPYGPPQYQQADDVGAPPQQNSVPEQAPQTTAAESSTLRVNRLRKACDACSVRKVKCDEAGPPCRACASLDIPCTFDRPSRRRGPPNRHAEAIKKQRLDQQGGGMSSMPASPSPAIQSLREVLNPVVQLQQQEQYLSAESICPIELLELLIDDYFIFCHPLTPFPHEPWFREAFAQRADKHDRLFLALLAGMIGSMTATYPRRPRKHMRALRREQLFNNSIDLVNRCQVVVHEARGTGYLERGMGAYDAAVSYFLFVMLTCTYRFKPGRLYLAECVGILRQLNLYDDAQHNLVWLAPQSDSTESNAEVAVPPNKIEQEMARRVFWTAFVSGRTGKTIGFNWVEPYMNPANPNSPHPPMPLELDDQYIYVDGVDPQPPGTVSCITAFNANVRVYLTLDPVIAIDCFYGMDQSYDWRKQLNVMDDCLEGVKRALNNMPEELSAWPRATSRSPSVEEYGFVKRELFDRQEPHTNGGPPPFTSISPRERRYITYETQKANIYTSYLSVRSYLTERRWSLMEAHVLPQNITQPGQQSDAQRELRAEREGIAQDLLGVLTHIRPIHLEPNSVSLFMKIRQVASTLLPLSTGPVSMGESGERIFTEDDRAAEYLRRFLEMLMELETCGRRKPSTNEPSDEANEDEELRKWADLREYQKQFAREGQANY